MSLNRYGAFAIPLVVAMLYAVGCTNSSVEKPPKDRGADAPRAADAGGADTGRGPIPFSPEASGADADLSTESPAIAEGVAVPPVASQEEHARLEEQIASIVAPFVRKIPALAIGVIKGGKQFHFGYGDVGGGKPPAPDTIFEIGSITKTFVGTALAQLVLEEKLEIDAKVRDVLPADYPLPPGSGDAITLRHLATHTSGLPREIKGKIGQIVDSLTGGQVTPEQLRKFLASARLKSEPGERFEYSNIGITVLAHALAHRDGTTWDAMLEKRVISPLGLADTVRTLSAVQLQRKVAGHSALGSKIKPVATYAPESDAYAPSGALHSTTTDMVRYLAAQLGMVSPEMQPAFGLARKVHYQRTDNAKRGFGLMWDLHLDDAGQAESAGHTGATPGYTCIVAFIPEVEGAFVVLANSYAAAGGVLGEPKLLVNEIARELDQLLRK